MKVKNKILVESVFNIYPDFQYHYSGKELHCYKQYGSIFVKITKSDTCNDKLTMWNLFVIEEVSPLNFIKRYDLSKGMLFKEEMLQRLKEIIKESWK